MPMPTVRPRLRLTGPSGTAVAAYQTLMARRSPVHRSSAMFCSVTATPKVRRIWLRCSAWRTRLISAVWTTAPSTARAAITRPKDTKGSTPQSVKSQNDRYAPSITNSPCAKFRMRMTPNTSVSPTATSA